MDLYCSYNYVFVVEWIKLKVSGQHCEPLELHEEDRRRIEEIKKELMRNPVKVIKLLKSSLILPIALSFIFIK